MNIYFSKNSASGKINSRPNRVELEEDRHTKKTFIEVNISVLLTTQQEMLISDGIVWIKKSLWRQEYNWWEHFPLKSANICKIHPRCFLSNLAC